MRRLVKQLGYAYGFCNMSSICMWQSEWQLNLHIGLDHNSYIYFNTTRFDIEFIK